MPSVRLRSGGALSGYGLAVSTALGLVVTSHAGTDTLRVFALPSLPGPLGSAWEGGEAPGHGAAGGGTSPLFSLGGRGSPPPLQFRFEDDVGLSGGLAFLPFATGPAGPDSSSVSGAGATGMLVVADARAGHDAVHIIDVARRCHAGYVAPPSTILGPRDVAMAPNGRTVAVSAWKGGVEYCVEVQLFQLEREVDTAGCGGTGWSPSRVVCSGSVTPDGMRVGTPSGLRFTADGALLALADSDHNRVTLFRVGDGGFVGHLGGTGRQRRLSYPTDLEECEDGDWLVTNLTRGTLHVVAGAAAGDGCDVAPTLVQLRPSLSCGSGAGVALHQPVSLVLVEGLGLLVRELGPAQEELGHEQGWPEEPGRSGVRLFATEDALAMAVMGQTRVGWMVAVARALVRWARREPC